MNRFWRAVLAGTTAGIVIGTYYFIKTKKGDTRLITGGSQAKEKAVRISGRILGTTDRLIKSIGRGVSHVGRNMQVLGNRLSVGEADRL
ncbi:MAG: hypothetical protein GX969_04950 [Firmicutes bacterium]|nr:hypothetical protein [Bacillota bacterium]